MDLRRSIENIKLRKSHTGHFITVFEVSIFNRFKIKNIGQAHGGEKLNLRCSIANVPMCIGDFFFIIVAARCMRKRTIFNIFAQKLRNSQFYVDNLRLRTSKI